MKKIDQKELFYKCLKYLNYLKINKIDISLSGYTYFCTWSKTIGYHRARSLILNNQTSFILESIKNFIKIGYLSNFELKFKQKSNLNTIFLAWSTNNTLGQNFHKSERYISGFKNERKNASWFLIHQDIYNKNFKLNNIFLLKRNKVFFNFFFFDKNFF